MTQVPTNERPGKDTETVSGAVIAKPIAIRLVSTEAEAVCRFWIGLTKRGDLSPQALLEEADVGGIFEKASHRGLNQEPPILLTDTQLVPPRYVYLLGVPEDDFRARTLWTQELIKSLRTLAPKSLGFYLAPELFAARQRDELLAAVLREFVDAAMADEIYLFVGSYGLNALLSSVLRLKAEFESQLVKLLVYH